MLQKLAWCISRTAWICAEMNCKVRNPTACAIRFGLWSVTNCVTDYFEMWDTNMNGSWLGPRRIARSRNSV